MLPGWACEGDKAGTGAMSLTDFSPNKSDSALASKLHVLVLGTKLKVCMQRYTPRATLVVLSQNSIPSREAANPPINSKGFGG